MGKNRPIVVATLGYIIGIIWGLYFKTNIVSFYALILMFAIVAKLIKKQEKRKFKFISSKKIFRYIKLILDFKSIIIIMMFSVISNLIVINLNNKYEKIYTGLKKVNITARIIDNGKDKEYKTIYKIKVENVNGKSMYKGTYLYLDVSKNLKSDLRYGDYIKVQGEYKAPSKPTNYLGFDYSLYLKTQKVYGTVDQGKITVLDKNTNNIFFTTSNNIFLRAKETVEENLPEAEGKLLLGILFGYKEEIPEEMQENFKESNISHVLAVSGLHVSYIILSITNILEKIQGKRISKIVVIFFIISYMFITNFSPSVVRAGLMGIIAVLAKLTYNKNDIWTSISISLLIILIYNPYLIISAGVLLSYGGTIGIILFQKNITHLFQKIRAQSKIYKYKANKQFAKIVDYIQDTISVSFSAQLFIAPIMARLFNTFSLSFFITNFFVSIIIGPIIIFGFLYIISNFLFSQIIKITIIEKLFEIIIEKMLGILILISKTGTMLPFNKIYTITPEMWTITTYYIVIFLVNIMYKIKNKKVNSAFENRLINWKNLIKHLIRKQHKKVVVVIICAMILVATIKIIPQNLKIYFIDVGQGDSTLIVTPHNKTILIDGGGSEDYDVGQNILLPYLLDRKILKLDYVIISHFDSDHVGGIFTVIKELNVEKVIIGKQYESSENWQEFLRIIKERKISIIAVEAGNRLNIEKNLYFDVLWPSSNKVIAENSLNNNSLVGKLYYKNFSMLFTGDIEEIAEKQIVAKYSNTKMLNSTVLKVAHHGSKTSSIGSFLKLVEPKVALIGVGRNNLYGHPNDDVLTRLEGNGTKIFRTDKNGEISIVVNNQGEIKVRKLMK